MNSSPLFSIVTVTLNNLNGLKKTGRSVAGQTCRSYEWIIIDGQSDDGTQEWSEDSGAALFISEKDSGLYDAMNKGIEKSTGQYVLFLNAGDLLESTQTLNTLETAIHINKFPEFIYGDSYETDTQNSKFYKTARLHEKIPLGMFTHHQAMLYFRPAIKDIRFDTQYTIAADYKFTAEFLGKVNRIFYTESPICIFESGGLSQQNMKTGRKEQYKIRHDLKLCGPVTNCLIYSAQTFISTFRTFYPQLYRHLKSSGNKKHG